MSCQIQIITVVLSNTDHNRCPVTKRFTRAEHEKKKECWRKAKATSRVNMSAQKKRRVREYDRNKKGMLRHKNKQPETIIMPCCPSLGSTDRPTVSEEHDVSLQNPTVLSKSAIKQRVF